MFANNWAVNRNAFVGVGDLTGDGRPDLVSRNSAGDLLRNKGNGSFGSTVKIGTGWQGYKGLFRPPVRPQGGPLTERHPFCVNPFEGIG